MHVDAVIELADPDRRLARDIAGAADEDESRGEACDPASSSPRSRFWSNFNPTRPWRVHITDAGIFCDESSTLTCSTDLGMSGAMAMRPPAERFLILISCCMPDASRKLGNSKHRGECARRCGARSAGARPSTERRSSNSNSIVAAGLRSDLGSPPDQAMRTSG